tara:strand:- start:3355 stop:3588 length:234 start_codon:yes stop_codon:yes gene_type:complete
MGSAALLSRLAADIKSINEKLDVIMDNLKVRDTSPTREKSTQTEGQESRQRSLQIIEWWKEESTNPDWEEDRMSKKS